MQVPKTSSINRNSPGFYVPAQMGLSTKIKCQTCGSQATISKKRARISAVRAVYINHSCTCLGSLKMRLMCCFVFVSVVADDPNRFTFANKYPLRIPIPLDGTPVFLKPGFTTDWETQVQN